MQDKREVMDTWDDPSTTWVGPPPDSPPAPDGLPDLGGTLAQLHVVQARLRESRADLDLLAELPRHATPEQIVRSTRLACVRMSSAVDLCVALGLNLQAWELSGLGTVRDEAKGAYRDAYRLASLVHGRTGRAMLFGAACGALGAVLGMLVLLAGLAVLL